MNKQYGLMTYFSIVNTCYIQAGYPIGFSIWKYKYFHPEAKIIRL